jgi:hypothetical protein
VWTDDAHADRVLLPERDREPDPAAERDVVEVGVDQELVAISPSVEANRGLLDVLARTLGARGERHGRLLHVGGLDLDVAPRELDGDGQLPRGREGLGPHRRTFGRCRLGGRRSTFASACFM